MPSVTAVYNSVLSQISSGDSRQPVLSKTIEHSLHITGSTVRDAVRYFRRRGEPIIATESGYYIATRQEEVQIVIRDLTARIASMSKTVAALRSKAAERFGTQAAFEWNGSAGNVGETVGTGAAAVSCQSSGPGKEEFMPVLQNDHGSETDRSIAQGLSEGSQDEALIDMLLVGLQKE